MAQLAQSVLGMGDAARVLDTPVVSGNVSLYNETDGRAILPCPVIGMVGTIDDISSAIGMAPAAGGLTLVVIGQSPDVDRWMAWRVALCAQHGRGSGRRAAAGRSGSRTQERSVRSAADRRRPRQRGA